MGNLLRNKTKGNTSHQRAGFTLLEILVALFVMGVATTILFFSLNSSIDLSRMNKKNAIAAHIAQEYMTELRVHPELFKWPVANAKDLKQITAKDESLLIIDPSKAIAPSEMRHENDKNLYKGFSWYAQSRLNDEQDNYLEVMVEIRWTDGGELKHFNLSSMMPRSIEEGVGL